MPVPDIWNLTDQYNYCLRISWFLTTTTEYYTQTLQASKQTNKKCKKEQKKKELIMKKISFTRHTFFNGGEGELGEGGGGT